MDYWKNYMWMVPDDVRFIIGLRNIGKAKAVYNECNRRLKMNVYSQRKRELYKKIMESAYRYLEATQQKV